MLQIIATLTGRSVAPILDRMVLDYVSRLTNQVVDTLWLGKQQNINMCSKALELFGSLPESRRTRLLLSPVFYSRLHSAKFNPKTEVISLIIEEISKMVDNDNGLDYLDFSPSSVIGDTITVDSFSIFARRIEASSPVFFSPGDPLTEQEHTCILKKLSGAIDGVDAASMVFGRLIRNYTRVIYVRKIPGESPASEQVDSEIGSIRLRNVQDLSYDPLHLEEDILHESVHNFLATYEILNFPFIVYGGSNNKKAARPVSPWSWRPIQALPFLHAVFVYFALWNLNLLRLEGKSDNNSDKEEIVSRLVYCASGFLVPGRLSQCIKTLADVDVRVTQAIDWMQDIVREQSQCFAGNH